MKRLFLLFFIVTCNYPAYCQSKPVIDLDACEKWVSVTSEATISNDGKYVIYGIKNQPYKDETLVIQRTNASWKQEFKGVKSGDTKFSDDSKTVCFTKGKDSLAIFIPTLNKINWISGVKTFKFTQLKNHLYYHLNNDSLIDRDLNLGKERIYKDVLSYSFNKTGTILYLITKNLISDNNQQRLEWINLLTNDRSVVFEGGNIKLGPTDKMNQSLVFIATDKQNVNCLWEYTREKQKIIRVVTEQDAKFKGYYELSFINEYYPEDKVVGIVLNEIGRKEKPSEVKLDLWSYTDNLFPGRSALQSFLKGFVNLGTRKFHWLKDLEQEEEGSYQNQRWIVSSSLRYDLEKEWSSIYEKSSHIIDKMGRIDTLIGLNKKYRRMVSSNPNGNFLIYFDGDVQEWMSYNVYKKSTISLTSGIKTNWLFLIGERESPRRYSAFVGWMSNGDALVSDAYDIWRLDVTGKRKPINVTRGYGAANHIIFQLASQDHLHLGSNPKNWMYDNRSYILSGFNMDTKETGFYEFSLSSNSIPRLLSKGAFTYTEGPTSNLSLYSFAGYRPKKSRDADVYIVQRATTESSPNYFSTKDFKTFTRLSDIHPEKEYNWLTSELMSWKIYDGTTSQGVLYKPENFDPAKRYPVIFHYYHTKSDALHNFKVPDLIYGGDINIPWLVSRGYLVFTPDIHYKLGHPGESAYNCVLSAADMVGKLPYVDSTKMAITGHSFGGYETNYIVTQTDKFAAAMSSSGSSDLISLSGERYGRGDSKQGHVQYGQYRMGKTLWEIPDQYVKNSPVFYTDKVSTPILLMANKADGSVPFAQGVEFFTGLRRLGKIAWMLQYDNGIHGLFTKPEQEDFTIRVMQFFDHYLKGKPAPMWMLQGIPTKDKGYVTGLELDTLGRTPLPGLHVRNQETKPN